jgi:hypothetical protein
MEIVMRMIAALGLLVMYGLSAAAPAGAEGLPVPAFKGNDTGGIIAYPLATQSDVKLLAIDHCARYGKVAKFLGSQPYYGGYVSFACRWVPYGSSERPLRASY